MISKNLVRIQSDLSDFADQSKIWVYYSEKDFSDQETEIQQCVNQFTSGWKSHGNSVKGFGYAFGGHIVLLVADITVSGVSGCSTDSSIKFIQSLGQQFQLDFFNRQLVLMNIDDKPVATTLHQLSFQSPHTLVFNPFFNDVRDWKAHFVQKLIESKYKRFATI